MYIYPISSETNMHKNIIKFINAVDSNNLYNFIPKNNNYHMMFYFFICGIFLPNHFTLSPYVKYHFIQFESYSCIFNVFFFLNNSPFSFRLTNIKVYKRPCNRCSLSEPLNQLLKIK